MEREKFTRYSFVWSENCLDFGDANGSDVAGRFPFTVVQATALELLPHSAVGSRISSSLRHQPGGKLGF